MSLLITPLLMKNVKDALKIYNYYIDNSFSNFEEKKVSLSDFTKTYKSITKKLCGADRPGHFSGVATIILKFLNLIQPDFLILGQKDYQQIIIIKQIIKDFFFKTKIIQLPTIRNKSGLALSSRNSLISLKKKEIAENIFVTLKLISDEIIKTGLKKIKLELYKGNLLRLGVEKINYLEILNDSDLSEINSKPTFARIFISVSISGVKLIDNIRIPIKIFLRSGKFVGN